MTPITSPDNPHYRELLKLARSAKDRRRSRQTILDGIHLVEAYRDHRGLPAQLVVSQSGQQAAPVRALLDSLPDLEPLVLANGLFGKLSPVDTPTGILAVIPVPERQPLPMEPGPCVLLEDIQDPGNLGAILRTAAAAGIREVYLSWNSTDAWSPRVLRAAMGAHFLLDIREDVDLGAFARDFEGRVIATHHQAKTVLFDADLTGRVALLFGNEGAGISRDLLAAVGTIVAIPMPGKTESLNIAAAAAICLFERVRQIRAGN